MNEPLPLSSSALRLKSSEGSRSCLRPAVQLCSCIPTILRFFISTLILHTWFYKQLSEIFSHWAVEWDKKIKINAIALITFKDQFQFQVKTNMVQFGFVALKIFCQKVEITTTIINNYLPTNITSAVASRIKLSCFLEVFNSWAGLPPNIFMFGLFMKRLNLIF